MTCAYFVSDLHLKSPDEASSQTFLRFLKRLKIDLMSGASERPTHLFLVGDIFDLWIGAHEYFVDRFADIVVVIRELVEAGVAVHFFEGNHDLHLTAFWQERLGVQVHPDAAYFELAGKAVRVEHGDLINPDDKGYLFLRRLLRTPIVKFVSLNLPSSVVNAIGEKASGASRQYTSAKEVTQDLVRAMIHKHAEKTFIEKPFDFLITGHVHILDDYEFVASGRSVRSVNLGSWFEAPRAFVISDQRAEFIDLPRI